MSKNAKYSVLVLLVGLGACGKVGPLTPEAGQAPPAKAYGSSEVAGSDALMTASEQARPGRSDELMRRSERRTDDPFDLPPGSDAKPVENPETADPAKPK